METDLSNRIVVVTGARGRLGRLVSGRLLQSGAAVAALVKGPQGPVYFVAITTTYMAVRRDRRFLF